MKSATLDPLVENPQPLVQTTMTPPMPSSLVNPFSGKAQDRINSIYGDTSQRQQSLANPPLFKLNPMYNGEPGVQREDFEQF